MTKPEVACATIVLKKDENELLSQPSIRSSSVSSENGLSNLKQMPSQKFGLSGEMIRHD